MIERVGVEGLSRLSRSLKQVSSDAPKALRIALNGASDYLITEARPLIPSRTGAARASLKAASTRTAVRVSEGGPKAPYMPWLDYGGKTGPNRSVERPFRKEGRYLYPTLRKGNAEFTNILQGALVRVAEGAGLEVS
ncbi:hypothetical protein Cme02nite_69420 [Catellatospora methionotrophica]|uniref:HK97 gp10 family phage protein n=1 Tax=Catellatospora methionotrophica TaxID=121620 RepID=A0A8J3LPY2_9ACTN|nr:HK97 gp10 family phage protein [Catellatospora methionotrophica]GIG18610.1 hypothetical protein Cme02nite_69420 [Catellatospora methionotrophica]